MNPKLKSFLIICAKQAVGAVIGNATLAALLPSVFNFHDAAHIMLFLKSTGGFILAAEGKVWLPKIIKWAQTDATPE